MDVPWIEKDVPSRIWAMSRYGSFWFMDVYGHPSHKKWESKQNGYINPYYIMLGRNSKDNGYRH
jgi:hypothetical protein